MDQLRKLIAALSMRQRIAIVAAVVGVGVALYALVQWHKEGDFKPLYAALSPEDASAVIEKLKGAGVEYRVSDNGSAVLAPSARVPELRLQMAAAGVPHSGRIGYELFDKNNFGVTDFAEQLNYHRALEGELERSMAGLDSVEQARVHISFPKDSVFLESRQPAKASVMLKLRPGAHLSGQNIQAVMNLVASAVEGLAPESVSVMDVRGNLLNRPRRPGSPDDPQPSEAGMEYRQKLENDLLSKVNAQLEPLLGADKYRAAVSVDCDLTSGEQSEEVLDPNKSVMLTSQKTEETSGGASSGGGVPGTASNLPKPPARAAGTGGGLTRRTENVTYQTSRLVRKTRLPQGNVKRVSLSVLLDHSIRYEGQGKTRKAVLTPPAPEKIKVLHELLAGVIGFSQERGDQIIIESLPFENTTNSLDAPPAPVADVAAPQVPKWLEPWLKQPKMLALIGAAAAGLLILLAGFGYFFSRRKTRKATTPAAIETSKPDPLPPAPPAEEPRALPVKTDEEILNGLRIPVSTTQKAEVLIRHIRENVAKDSANSANVVRAWLAEAENL